MDYGLGICRTSTPTQISKHRARLNSSNDDSSQRNPFKDVSEKDTVPPDLPRDSPTLHISRNSRRRRPFRPSRSGSEIRAIQSRNAITLREHSAFVFRQEEQHIQPILRKTRLGVGYNQLFLLPLH